MRAIIIQAKIDQLTCCNSASKKVDSDQLLKIPFLHAAQTITRH